MGLDFTSEIFQTVAASPPKHSLYNSHEQVSPHKIHATIGKECQAEACVTVPDSYSLSARNSSI